MPQTAFGPLIEPEAGPPAPDLGAKFLTGFQVGASISAKQRALENQLAMYALKAQGMENDRALDQAKFELAQGKLMQDYGFKAAAADRAEDLLRIRGAQFDLATQKFDNKITTDNLERDQTSNFYQHLHGGMAQGPEYMPGGKNYLALLSEAAALNPAASAEVARMNKQHADIVGNQEKALQQQFKATLAQAGSDLKLPGGSKYDDASPFLNPETRSLRMFETEPSDAEKAQGKAPVPAAQGSHMRTDAATGLQTEVKYKKDANGNMVDSPNIGLYIPPTVPGTEGTYAVVPKKDLDHFSTKIKGLDEKIRNLPARDTQTPTDTSQGQLRILTPGDFKYAPRNVPLIWFDPEQGKDRIIVKH